MRIRVGDYLNCFSFLHLDHSFINFFFFKAEIAVHEFLTLQDVGVPNSHIVDGSTVHVNFLMHGNIVLVSFSLS